MCSAATDYAPPPPHVPQDLVVDFDLFRPAGAETDFHRAWQDFRSRAPGDLVWTVRNGGHWIALSGTMIRTMFQDHAHFSSRTAAVPREHAHAVQSLPIPLDPPRHTPYRALINPGLSPNAVRSMEPFVRQLAIERIEAVKQQGGCDFIRDFAEHLPIRVFMRIVDLPIESAPQLRTLVEQITRPDGAIPIKEVMGQLHGFLAQFIEERRQAPGEDMLSTIANGLIGNELIRFEDAVSMSTQLLFAGLDTVVSFLGFSMHFLAQSPEHRAMLVDEPELIPGAVDELLRRFGMVTMARELVDDFLCGSVLLAKGDVIALPTFLHGLDEREFKDPLHVDFRRAVKFHASFGNGRHRCPGMHLAHAEMRITLEEWLRRIPRFWLDTSDPVRMASGLAGVVFNVPLVWPVGDR
jgi:cytochrome P450